MPIQNQSDTGHVYHLYVVRINPAISLDRNRMADELHNRSIQTGVHYPVPCHLQPAYQYLGYQAGDFPHAEALCEQILSLPMFPGLSATQIHQVVDAIASAATSQLSAA